MQEKNLTFVVNSKALAGALGVVEKTLCKDKKKFDGISSLKLTKIGMKFEQNTITLLSLDGYQMNKVKLVADTPDTIEEPIYIAVDNFKIDKKACDVELQLSYEKLTIVETLSDMNEIASNFFYENIDSRQFEDFNGMFMSKEEEKLTIGFNIVKLKKMVDGLYKIRKETGTDLVTLNITQKDGASIEHEAINVEYVIDNRSEYVIDAKGFLLPIRLDN